MDILISSNLERFLYHLSGCNAEEIKEYMSLLSKDGKYEISSYVKEEMQKIFCADFADDKETKETIRRVFEDKNYVLDTHTAVAYAVYEKYALKTGDATKTVIASTASPFKFSKSVMQGIKNDDTYGSDANEFDILEELSEISGEEIPESLAELKTKPVLFDVVYEKDEMPEAVKEFLRL